MGGEGGQSVSIKELGRGVYELGEGVLPKIIVFLAIVIVAVFIFTIIYTELILASYHQNNSFLTCLLKRNHHT